MSSWETALLSGLERPFLRMGLVPGGESGTFIGEENLLLCPLLFGWIFVTSTQLSLVLGSG